MTLATKQCFWELSHENDSHIYIGYSGGDSGGMLYVGNARLRLINPFSDRFYRITLKGENNGFS